MIHLLLLILSQFYIFVVSDNIDFESPDIKITIESIQINVFKSLKNEELYNEMKFSQLKWYSIGSPAFIKTVMPLSSNDSKLIHFTSNGFSMFIQVLTDEHKEFIKNEINKKYKIKIESRQIENLPFDSFECKIKLYDKRIKVNMITGKVSKFDTIPLQIDFKTIKIDKKLINKKFNESSFINCEIKKDDYEEDVIVRILPQFAFSPPKSKVQPNEVILNFNCNYGLLFKCVNGGICTSSGTCNCTIGYGGTTCSNYLGCNENNSIPCNNGGTCLPNGHCQCRTGFTGPYCLIELKEVNNFIEKFGIMMNDVDARYENGDTALILASRHGYKSVIKFLLNSKFNVEAKNSIGETALICAARKGHKDVVKILVENKANVNSRDNNEWTALIDASRHGHREIVRILLDNKADVNIKNNQGDTALIKASRKGYKNIVKMLLDNKADVNIKNNLGDTALILASWYGHKDIVKMLLDNNADLYAKDNEGFNALYYAMKKNHKDIIDIINANINNTILIL